MIMSLFAYRSKPHNLPQGHTVKCLKISIVVVKLPDGKGMKISD